MRSFYRERGIMPLAILQLLAAALLSLNACGQARPRSDVTTFDPALVQEQARRIAAFDSVVRTVNTDSAYKLWHWTLMLPDPKRGELEVECEYFRITRHYGAAGRVAINRMRDTLWRGTDPEQLRRLREGLRGGSLSLSTEACGPFTTSLAPYWLRNWYVYPLPQLPPSPGDSTPPGP